jgi:hypothetical protein
VLRAAFIFLLVLCTAAGCAGGERAGVAPSSDCAAHLNWKGITYEGIVSKPPPEPGRRLGEATAPACGPGSQERVVDVVAVRGLDPSVAIVSPGPADYYPGSELVFLGPGYPASSPKHPFHDAVEPSVGGWDAERRFVCGVTKVLTARVHRAPGALHGYLEVTAGDEAARDFLTDGDVRGIVSLDDDTSIIGLERNGIPFVQVGEAIELEVSECEGEESEPGFAGLRKLIVREIRPAAPGD